MRQFTERLALPPLQIFLPLAAAVIAAVVAEEYFEPASWPIGLVVALAFTIGSLLRQAQCSKEYRRARASTALQTTRMNGFVPIRDPQRARAFYEDVLRFRLIRDNEYVATYQGGTMTLMLQKMRADAPAQQRTILGWEVNGIREIVAGLTHRGVHFERVPGLDQDDLGIWHSPDGEVAWFKDPDGNTLSVSEHEPVIHVRKTRPQGRGSPQKSVAQGPAPRPSGFSAARSRQRRR